MRHFLNKDIAVECGIHAALLLQHIYFWVTKNAENAKNYEDGRYWTYNTILGFLDVFPYMKRCTVRAAFKKLVEAGLIETGNYNKAGMDRTIWYTVTKKAVDILEKDDENGENTTIVKKLTMQSQNIDNAMSKNRQCKVQKLTMQSQNIDNQYHIYNQIYNTDKEPDIKRKSKKKIPAKDLPPDFNDDPENKKQYGNYVFLTDAEYQSLLKKCGGSSDAVDELIEMLDSYKGRNRRGYYSDVDALRGWCFKQYKQDHRFDKPATADNFTKTMEILKRGEGCG